MQGGTMQTQSNRLNRGLLMTTISKHTSLGATAAARTGMLVILLLRSWKRPKRKRLAGMIFEKLSISAPRLPVAYTVDYWRYAF